MNDRSPSRPVLLAIALVCAAAIPVIGVLTVPEAAWWGADVVRSKGMFDVGLRHDLLAGIARWVGYLTVPTVLRVLALVGAVVLWRRGLRTAAVWLVVTMLIGGAVAIGLRYAVGRPRPDWPGSGPPVEGFTFPSGHATNAAVFAGCLVILAWPYLDRIARFLAVLAGVAFVVLVGASRVVLGVHRISDVLAAWLLAVALVTFMVAIEPAFKAPRGRLGSGGLRSLTRSSWPRS